MEEGPITWDRNLLKTFLDCCVDEVHKCNCIKGRMSKTGWANVLKAMEFATGRRFKPKSLYNKFSALRSEYIAWNKLRNKTGGGIDPRTGCIEAPPHWWEEAMSEIPGASQFRKRPLWFEDEMDIIFCETAVGTGDLLWPGGDELPSAGTEEGRDDWDDLHETEASGSQRPPRRSAVDSVSPKKRKKTYQEYQLKRFVDSFEESVKFKSSSSDANRSEIHSLMAQLREDGLAEDSHVFYFATDLLKDPANRSILMGFTEAKARLGWVQFHWEKENRPKQH